MSRQSRSGGENIRREGLPQVPGWLPPALFALLTLVLFRVFIFGHGMLFGGDTVGLGYQVRAFYAEQLRAGSFPRWLPQILGGTPFLEALSGGDSLYPTSLLLLVMEPFRALGWKLVIHVFLAGLFMVGWVRSVGVSKAGAVVSGTAYMLAPYFVTLVRPGHDGKIFVTALTPLLFWMVERFLLRPGAARFAAVALVVAVTLYSTHFQMAYFLFGAVGLYAAFRVVTLGRATAATEGRARGIRLASARFALFLAAALGGATAASVQLIPAARYVTEYSRRTQTTREEAGHTGAAWSSAWSLHPEEVMSLLIPEFTGGDGGGAAWTDNTYWGRNDFKTNAEYAGILVLILATVSFGGAARRLRWFLTGLGGLALLYALGRHTPIWGLFYALMPGVRLFRSPSMVIFLFGFAAATLAGLGVDRLLLAARDGAAWPTIQRVLWGWTGALAVLALLASTGTVESLWVSVVRPDMTDIALTRLSTLTPYIAQGAWIGTALALALAGGAWALRAGRVRPAAFVALVVTLAAVDALRVDAPFVQVIDFQRWAAPSPLIQAIERMEQGRSEPYRVLSFVNRAQDVKPMIYGMDLAAGHHPNDLARYRELIGMVGSDLPRNLFAPNIERLLNVRYMIWPDHNGQGPADDSVIARTTLDGRPFETLHGRRGLPRARLVTDAVVLPDAEQVAYMLSPAFDPATQVVLDEAPPVALDAQAVDGSVTWTERTPNRLSWTVRSDRPALLVVADNWFPAWHATVDGTKAPVLRAYHTLRAVPVPAGTHTVTMAYRSTLVTWTMWLSLASLAALLGLLVVGMRSGPDRQAPRPASTPGS